jgi:hypothetical protein
VAEVGAAEEVRAAWAERAVQKAAEMGKVVGAGTAAETAVDREKAAGAVKAVVAALKVARVSRQL